jgi:hypothetical protein
MHDGFSVESKVISDVLGIEKYLRLNLAVRNLLRGHHKGVFIEV